MRWVCLSVNYVTRGYQVPLYPNAMQKVLLKKTFGCTRLIFNHFLAIQKESLMNQGHIYTKNSDIPYADAYEKG